MATVAVSPMFCPDTGRQADLANFNPLETNRRVLNMCLYVPHKWFSVSCITHLHIANLNDNTVRKWAHRLWTFIEIAHGCFVQPVMSTASWATFVMQPVFSMHNREPLGELLWLQVRCGEAEFGEVLSRIFGNVRIGRRGNDLLMINRRPFALNSSEWALFSNAFPNMIQHASNYQDCREEANSRAGNVATRFNNIRDPTERQVRQAQREILAAKTLAVFSVRRAISIVGRDAIWNDGAMAHLNDCISLGVDDLGCQQFLPKLRLPYLRRLLAFAYVVGPPRPLGQLEELSADCDSEEDVLTSLQRCLPQYAIADSVESDRIAVHEAHEVIERWLVDSQVKMVNAGTPLYFVLEILTQFGLFLYQIYSADSMSYRSAAVRRVLNYLEERQRDVMNYNMKLNYKSAPVYSNLCSTFTAILHRCQLAINAKHLIGNDAVVMQLLLVTARDAHREFSDIRSGTVRTALTTNISTPNAGVGKSHLLATLPLMTLNVEERGFDTTASEQTVNFRSGTCRLYDEAVHYDENERGNAAMKQLLTSGISVATRARLDETTQNYFSYITTSVGKVTIVSARNTKVNVHRTRYGKQTYYRSNEIGDTGMKRRMELVNMPSEHGRREEVVRRVENASNMGEENTVKNIDDLKRYCQLESCYVARIEDFIRHTPPQLDVDCTVSNFLTSSIRKGLHDTLPTSTQVDDVQRLNTYTRQMAIVGAIQQLYLAPQAILRGKLPQPEHISLIQRFLFAQKSHVAAAFALRAPTYAAATFDAVKLACLSKAQNFKSRSEKPRTIPSNPHSQATALLRVWNRNRQYRDVSSGVIDNSAITVRIDVIQTEENDVYCDVAKELRSELETIVGYSETRQNVALHTLLQYYLQFDHQPHFSDACRTMASRKTLSSIYYPKGRPAQLRQVIGFCQTCDRWIELPLFYVAQLSQRSHAECTSNCSTSAIRHALFNDNNRSVVSRFTHTRLHPDYFMVEPADPAHVYMIAVCKESLPHHQCTNIKLSYNEWRKFVFRQKGKRKRKNEDEEVEEKLPFPRVRNATNDAPVHYAVDTDFVMDTTNVSYFLGRCSTCTARWSMDEAEYFRSASPLEDSARNVANVPREHRQPFEHGWRSTCPHCHVSLSGLSCTAEPRFEHDWMIATHTSTCINALVLYHTNKALMDFSRRRGPNSTCRMSYDLAEIDAIKQMKAFRTSIVANIHKHEEHGFSVKASCMMQASCSTSVPHIVRLQRHLTCRTQDLVVTELNRVLFAKKQITPNYIWFEETGSYDFHPCIHGRQRRDSFHVNATPIHTFSDSPCLPGTEYHGATNRRITRDLDIVAAERRLGTMHLDSMRNNKRIDVEFLLEKIAERHETLEGRWTSSNWQEEGSFCGIQVSTLQHLFKSSHQQQSQYKIHYERLLQQLSENDEDEDEDASPNKIIAAWLRLPDGATAWEDVEVAKTLDYILNGAIDKEAVLIKYVPVENVFHAIHNWRYKHLHLDNHISTINALNSIGLTEVANLIKDNPQCTERPVVYDALLELRRIHPESPASKLAKITKFVTPEIRNYQLAEEIRVEENDMPIGGGDNNSTQRWHHESRSK